MHGTDIYDSSLQQLYSTAGLQKGSGNIMRCQPLVVVLAITSFCNSCKQKVGPFVSTYQHFSQLPDEIFFP